ncbi:MAG: polyprenyl synthetase family protein [Halioglobus sp.]
MEKGFTDFLRSCQERCRQSLPTMMGAPASEFIHGEAHGFETLIEASHYSLSNGGKRVRPLLVYGAAHIFDKPMTTPGLDHAACAIEMIHTYSLIHDDLPAMDDDDLRRGNPSCHKSYGEATAILAGDGLQARAFELICEAPLVDPKDNLQMIKILSAAAGPRGMVGGQAIDILAINSEMNIDQLKNMHLCKTGALIRAALSLGAIVGGADKAQLEALQRYGEHIGLAFQVVDDILDVEGNAESLGKTAGKDIDANKPTYVKMLGLERAKQEAKNLLEDALQSLEVFGSSGDHLRGVANYIVNRRN